MDKQIVMFDLGNQTFGVDVASVDRVGQIPEIINKPKSPIYIEGQLSLCGCVMPVVDLHRWFGMQGQERTEESRILVADLHGIKIGMIVSAVTDVLAIDENKIDPPTTKSRNEKLDYVLGFTKVNEQLVTLIDLDQVLTNEEKDQLELFHFASH